MGQFDLGGGVQYFGPRTGSGPPDSERLIVGTLVYRFGLIALGVSGKELRRSIAGVSDRATGGDWGIAIAVFDVAKFIIEEEVLNGRERRIASEARRSLTKFISTIAIAVFLEALVIVFRVSASRIPELLYPTLLLVAATLLVLGLGLYQRLSVTVEREVETHDRSEEQKHAT